MTRAALLALAFQVGVIALAWARSRRRPEHRPFALWSTTMLVVDMIGWINIYAFPWLSSPGPFSGMRRVIFHVDSALFNAWPVGVAMMAWAIFLRRRPWPPLLVGTLVVAALVLGYPSTFRGALLGRAYAGIHGAALASTAVAVLAWSRRQALPRPEHAAALFVGFLDLAYFAGPYAAPDPWEQWSAAERLPVMIWGGLLLIHAGALWADFLMSPETPQRERKNRERDDGAAERGN
jgi:hypothetical protein